ncbi:hypothetical protein Ddc_16974 [Ditylenchus destructor]|nr:hypothetical protein Ddc_16974 [Ditylenchus destructor]
MRSTARVIGFSHRLCHLGTPMATRSVHQSSLPDLNATVSKRIVPQVNATSAVAASANGTVLAQISGQVAVYVDETFWEEHVSLSVYYLFLNASGSVYNDDTWQYEADCDSAGNVTLSFGNGNLVFTPSDYLEKIPESDACRLSMRRDYYSSGDYIELGRRYLNTHCVAYNAQSHQFGFAKVQPAVS